VRNHIRRKICRRADALQIQTVLGSKRVVVAHLLDSILEGATFVWSSGLKYIPGSNVQPRELSHPLPAKYRTVRTRLPKQRVTNPRRTAPDQCNWKRPCTNRPASTGC
jgi:hypothetical protein